MKFVISIVAVLLLGSACQAATVVSSAECTSTECLSSFGHAPTAYCFTEHSRQVLGEIVSGRDEFYAFYGKNDDGTWNFRTRNDKVEVILRLNGSEFSEASGHLQFTLHDTLHQGECRRFTGQRLHRATTEHHPVEQPVTVPTAQPGFIVPRPYPLGIFGRPLYPARGLVIGSVR